MSASSAFLKQPPSVRSNMTADPTPNSPATSVRSADRDYSVSSFGFPPGYFVIKSVANGRCLDVEKNSAMDGADVILWPETDDSLVEGIRRDESDNQVFFIDYTGALCSKSAGHAIDIEDDRLVLRHRRPVIHPFPNDISHPLPRFSYSPATGQISVSFAYEPTYPIHGADSAPPGKKSYLLSSIPLRKPRSMLDDAGDFLTANITNPLSGLFGSAASPSRATANEVLNSDIDIRDDEVVEDDRGEADEADDSLEQYRHVCAVAESEESRARLTEKGRERRQWRILPIRSAKARTR